jgi:predicted permease
MLAGMTLMDLRQAVRTWRRQPAFAAAVAGVLALAVGANAAMYTVVQTIVLRPLPLREPDRLVTFSLVRPGTDRYPLSVLDVDDFAQSTRTLEGVASFFAWSVNVTGSGDAERLTAVRVSANYFDLTGAQVHLGRPIRLEDEPRAVTVLSHGIWQRRFGGRPDIIGKSVVLNGEAFMVVGILRPEFVTLVRDVDFVVPYSPAADVRRANRAQAFLRVIARIKPSVTDAQLTDDLAAIGGRLRDEHPGSHGTDIGVRVVRLHEEIGGRAAPMLWTLFGAVVIVLLVACANLANLFLIRATTRQRELALRTALGASRLRIVGQVLGEAAVLGAVGGVAGLVVARMLVAALLAIGPADLPRVTEVGVGWSAAGFTLLVALGASLVVGLAPAVHAWRGDVRGALQGGDRGASQGRGRVRTLLVFAEVALSTVLLLTAVVLGRSFQQVHAVDPGFRPAQVLTIRLSLPRARYNGGAAIERFYDQVQPRLASLAGVRAVAAANVVPMNGYLATAAFFVDGVVARDAPEAHYRMVSPDYFRVLGIPLREGRGFTAADRRDARPVAIVNATFARLYFGAGSAVGRRMRLADGGKMPREVEIVGVVGDVRHFGLEKEVTLEAYVPLGQVPDPTTIWLANNMYWVLHTDGSPLALANTVRREISAVDPTVAASFVRSMEQWMAGTLAPRRFNLQLVAAFAASALVLAMVGVYAVSAAAVAARRREIGIRAALGASRREVVTLVLRTALTPVLGGLATGIAVVVLAGGALRRVLFGVQPGDPVSIAAAVATLAIAAVLANLIPALRAANIDPVAALRVD